MATTHHTHAASPPGSGLAQAVKASAELRPGDSVRLAGLGAFTVAAAPVPLPRAQVCVPLGWERLAIVAARDAAWDAASPDPPTWQHRSCPSCGGSGPLPRPLEVPAMTGNPDAAHAADATPGRPPFRALVTGSRAWADAEAVTAALDALLAEHGDRLAVAHGACPRGADAIADAWCRRMSVRVERHPADWTQGRRAGMARNAAMVATRPDLCLAFIQDGSAGATHCAGLAEQAGIPTVRATAATGRAKGQDARDDKGGTVTDQEHYAEAERLIHEAIHGDRASAGCLSPETRGRYIAAAQVHATLAFSSTQE